MDGLDATDRAIIMAIINGGSHTLPELTKKIFVISDEQDLRDKNSFLRYRLSKLTRKPTKVLAYDKATKKYSAVDNIKIGFGILNLVGVDDDGTIVLIDGLPTGVTAFVPTEGGTDIILLDQGDTENKPDQAQSPG